jgi:hypothetical protein
MSESVLSIIGDIMFISRIIFETKPQTTCAVEHVLDIID